MKHQVASNGSTRNFVCNMKILSSLLRFLHYSCHTKAIFTLKIFALGGLGGGLKIRTPGDRPQHPPLNPALQTKQAICMYHYVYTAHLHILKTY